MRRETSGVLRVSFVVSLLTYTTLVCASGCGWGSKPTATVSDPAVYRSSDVERAADEYAGGDLSVHLKRYFGTTTGQYAPLRIDEMLDDAQRAGAFAQAVEAKTVIDLTFSPQVVGATTNPSTKPASGTAAPSGGAATRPAATDGGGDATEKRPAAAKAEELRAFVDSVKDFTATDSPFDRLDRATDLYTAYLLKHVRRIKDSRTLPTTAPAPATQPAHGTPADYRLLWLVFPVHVHPGSRPNHMTGVRIKVLGGTDRAGKRVPAEEVRIVRLHPTRSYDVEQVGFSESLADLAILKAAANASGGGVDAAVKVAREVQRRSEARRRFIARIGKTASFADADERTFGWNFYPSNLQVHRTSWLKQLLGGGEYVVDGYLEGGARDCLAVAVVPANLASIRCRTYQVSAAIDQNSKGNNDKEEVVARWYEEWIEEDDGALEIARDDSKDGSFLIRLPDVDTAEQARREMPAVR